MIELFLLAHLWYDPVCCDNRHCRPVAATEVLEIEGGWKHLPSGATFSGAQIRPSRDSNFHVCIGSESVPPISYCIYILSGT